jgi:hypothetical protein
MTQKQINWSLIWRIINAATLIVSCASLMLLFPETVYRDNYRNYKNGGDKGSLAIEKNNESITLNKSATAIIDDINSKIKTQANSSIDSCSSVCNSLYTNQNLINSCHEKIMRKKERLQYSLIDENTYPLLTQLQQSQNAATTEDMLYSKYLESKELGVKLQFVNHLTGPHLFIMIFVFLGLAAASIGNLVIEAINKKSGRNNANPPLIGLLLGPVVSCLVAAILIYIFTPSGEERQYFSKKILDIPIAVYISSFLLSFSPVSTIENIANFAYSQIKSIVGSSSSKLADTQGRAER